VLPPLNKPLGKGDVNMPKIKVYGIGEGWVEAGTTILDAIRKIGAVIESPCGGAGICGKCKVRLNAAGLRRVQWAKNPVLPAGEREQGYVLSCETRIFGDITVYTAETNRHCDPQGGKPLNITLNPYIRKVYDAARDMTEVFAGNGILTVETGNTTQDNYGVSLDIGTTTLVLSLTDLNTGAESDSISAMNPQAIYAQDVLSRIKFAETDNGLHILHQAIISEINRMITVSADRHGVATDRIYEIVFSGNTCMLHLALGVSPASLGKYPYTPALTGGITLPSAPHGLNISPHGLIYLPPVVSGYVGADVTSGILASDLFGQAGVTLFIDIGTNGEMVVNVNGRVSAASAAAGPAFEGMNIENGMRAGTGAIERFELLENGAEIGVIGGGQATGICGSGLIDILSELVQHGIISKDGRFSEEGYAGYPDRFLERDGKKAFHLRDGVILSQKDVRQAQLAKGAIRAGIESLLRAEDLMPAQVDRILIAGSFGYHLREKSLVNIGLLPKAFEGKIEFVGNTSREGGKAFLLCSPYRAQFARLVKEIQVVELSNSEDFSQLFVKCLNF
jgi:uncharacterized 2Fe-2S/4Fe-4S cluster protein (DUF4445 family)